MKRILVIIITITLLTGCKANANKKVDDIKTESTTTTIATTTTTTTIAPVEPETTTTVPVTTITTTTIAKPTTTKPTTKKTSVQTQASVQKTQAPTTINTQTTTTIIATTITTTTQPTLTEGEVVAAINSFRSSYPTGTPWDNSNSYAWKGGTYSVGYGCAGFAFMLSDAAFGTRKARKHTDFDSIRVGDVVRYLYDSHSVIVLKREGNIFTVTEGNMNSAVYWDRKISLDEFKASGSYVFTRW